MRKDVDGTYCLVAEKEGDNSWCRIQGKAHSGYSGRERRHGNAAVTSTLTDEDKVIVGSSKEIAPEDKVRLKE